MRNDKEIEIKVGLFVAVGAALIMLAIATLGGATGIFTRTDTYYGRFDVAQGLLPGARVVLAGLNVGSVKSVDFDPETGEIIAELTINKKSSNWIRKDSTLGIVTQGLLGDKFLTIARGSVEAEKLPSESYIPTSSSKGLAEVLNKSDHLMASLNSISASLDRLLKEFEKGQRSEQFFEGMAKTATSLSRTTEHLEKLKLAEATQNLNRILEKIDNGTGTLGALVNDPGLYQDIKALVGGANRNRIVRNLVRKTIKDNEEAQSRAAAAAKQDEKEALKKSEKKRAPGSNR